MNPAAHAMRRGQTRRLRRQRGSSIQELSLVVWLLLLPKYGDAACRAKLGAWRPR